MCDEKHLRMHWDTKENQVSPSTQRGHSRHKQDPQAPRLDSRWNHSAWKSSHQTKPDNGRKQSILVRLDRVENNGLQSLLPWFSETCNQRKTLRPQRH